MFRWIIRKMNYIKDRNNYFSEMDQRISSKLSDNELYLKQLFQDSYDFVLRTVDIGKNREVKSFLAVIDGIYDKSEINENVIRPLIQLDFTDKNKEGILNHIDQTILTLSEVTEETSMQRSVDLLMQGDALLFIEGLDKVYVLGVRSWEMRGIEEPVSETIIRGPREGFIETLRTNTALLRRKIHHPDLTIEKMNLGKISKTDVVIVYIKGIVNESILEEVKNRLNRINTDAILDTGYTEEFIEDAPFSLFSTVSHTERPDVVASRILEGRVAILQEGSPVALTVPQLLIENFQSPQDYYNRPYCSSMIRMIRILAFVMALLTPAVYVASETYHKEIFPLELLISIAASREQIPFPLFMEVFIMILGFEFLKEAGLRMPKHIGQALSIVGALVLGEAAVNAGFASAPTVILVAVSAITGLVTPQLCDAVSIYRLIFLFVAAGFGLYGVILLLTVTLFHLASLRSFGVPFTSPWFPISWNGWKDFFIRVPFWAQKRRPDFLRSHNQIRQGSNTRPSPPKKEEGESS